MWKVKNIVIIDTFRRKGFERGATTAWAGGVANQYAKGHSDFCTLEKIL